jgi:hypothetical protein
MGSQNTNDPQMKPEEAQHLLEDVSAIRQSVQWRPNPWVVTLFAVMFAALVTTAVWDMLTWTFSLVALLALVLAVFRKQLFPPHTRERPVVDFDHEQDKKSNWWRESVWFLWTPVAVLLPPEPWWLGLTAGILAGLHVHYALRDH